MFYRIRVWLAEFLAGDYITEVHFEGVTFGVRKASREILHQLHVRSDAGVIT
jgi:O-succinylbenzoate synthase